MKSKLLSLAAIISLALIPRDSNALTIGLDGKPIVQIDNNGLIIEDHKIPYVQIETQPNKTEIVYVGSVGIERTFVSQGSNGDLDTEYFTHYFHSLPAGISYDEVLEDFKIAGVSPSVITQIETKILQGGNSLANLVKSEVEISYTEFSFPSPLVPLPTEVYKVVMSSTVTDKGTIIYVGNKGEEVFVPDRALFFYPNDMVRLYRADGIESFDCLDANTLDSLEILNGNRDVVTRYFPHLNNSSYETK